MSDVPCHADHAAPPAPWVARARKFLISACGVAAMVVSTGALTGHAEVWVNAALGVATAAGVYGIRNAPTV